MNRQRMIIGAALLLGVGVVWITSYWNGSFGFAVGHPIAVTKLSLNVAVTGWPALGGGFLTVLGVILLVLSAILSVIDLVSARKA